MRPATFLAALGLFFGAVSAAPQVESTNTVDTNTSPVCFSELECSGLLDIVTPEINTPTPIVERELTNAARLARGLPLKTPSRRFTPTRIHRSVVSPGVTVHGYIRVDRADGSGNLGYLSAHPFSAAQHGINNKDNAMIVNFITPSTGTTESQIDIATENSDIQSTFPRLSLVQGRDDTTSDLAAGSYHYAYIAGSDATAPGAPAQAVPNSYTAATGMSRTAQSAVWSYDSSTQKVAPSWVNSNGDIAPTNLFTQSNALYAGGDQAAFNSRYPAGVTAVALFFEPLGL